MRRPIFIRAITDIERKELSAGLRSSDAFVLRRCQIVLASARGEQAPQIASSLSCDDQTVRNAIKAFNEKGISCLSKASSRPHTTRAAFNEEGLERLQEILHHTPRAFGKPTSLWTLALAAHVSFEQGLTPERVSAETVRATLERLGIHWMRAKDWISSPDPQYARKKGAVTD